MTNKKDQEAKPEEIKEKKVKEPSAEERIEKLQNEVQEWKDKTLHVLADMENLRKRTQIDLEKASKYAQGTLAKELLPVVDCLEQAIEAGKKEGGKADVYFKNLLAGIEMTHKKMLDALAKNGIEKMKTLGKEFDPHFHKAIVEIEDKTHPAGTVVQEMQSGYLIGKDRVLREAMVGVSK